MRDIPLIPVCHAGLLPEDLRMPLSLKQGLALGEAEGLQRLYTRVANVLKCNVPPSQYGALAAELTRGDNGVRGPSQRAVRELDDDRGIRRRITESLRNPRFRWRTLQRVAVEAAISEDQAADILRSDPTVRTSIGKSRRIIVGLRSRVGDT
jgi:hypothetical protein